MERARWSSRLHGVRSELALLALLAAAGVCVHVTNRALESRGGQSAPDGDVGALPDGGAVRVLSLGFDRLIADLFWLRTVYYVGDERAQAAGFPAVDRLANLVTDIDPSFTTVYVVMSGAIGFLKGDPDASIALLEKGIRNVEYWKLHFLLGFAYFNERLDYARAAKQMEIAAAQGGPPYLPLLASRLYASAGESETALALIQARLREEPQEETRAALQKRVWDLWITRDLASIDAAIESYRARQGRAPLVMEELVRSRALEREPRDPRGGRYRIEAGRAVTDLEYDDLKVHRPYRPLRPPPAAAARAAAEGGSQP